MNNETKKAEYAYLVFMYGLDLVNNVLYHMEHRKDRRLNVPKRYKVVAQDCADYYNRWHTGKQSNGK